jgi:cytochrome c-type biogenesis protein CcmE
MKNKKLKWIIGIAVIVVFAVLALYSFQSSLNPYVTIAEAAETARQVQVMGYIEDPASIGFDRESGKLQFLLTDDEGTTVKVIYEGPRPDNLDHADSIVVVGYYRDGLFAAEKLLVKCPSKYEQDGDNNQ